MRKVYPIKSKQKIRDIIYYLKRTNERDYILFLTGIYSGLRISDIVKLRVSDVFYRDVIRLKEKKTEKMRDFHINSKLQKEYTHYCRGKESSAFLFRSREGENNPISTVRAYQILSEVGNAFDMKITGHVMRKTFGYHYYMNNNKDVAKLQTIFNHSSQEKTLVYIGIKDKEFKEGVENLNYF